MTPKKKAAKKKPARKKAAKKKPARKKAAKKKATRKKAAKKKPTRKKATRKAAAPHPEYRLSNRHADDQVERRADERHDGALEVEIEMFGYQRDAREFGIAPTVDPDRKIQSLGKTVNLSVGGMLAHIDDPIVEGSHCLVRFLNAGSGLRPDLRWGMVLRCAAAEDGRFEVAVHFNSPLEHLDADQLAAA